jgi:hypothetical protein
MRSDALELTACKVQLGLLPAAAVPDVATEALARACDTPALRRLAGLMGSETEEVGPLLDRALAELGSPPLSDAAAVMRLAREISQAIIAGTTAPYDGAKEIWALTLRAPGERFPDLDAFIYAASEWEERPEDRQFFDEAIVAAARES